MVILLINQKSAKKFFHAELSLAMQGTFWHTEIKGNFRSENKMNESVNINLGLILFF